MCLVLFALDCHPRYQLVLASNRDEFYERPTLPASFWPDHLELLAGKDLRQGGTWLGVTTGGRFAVLTNYRDPSNYQPEGPSRGKLVHKYLSTNLDPKTYIENLGDIVEKYNGFNLLFGTISSLYYYSNLEKRIRHVKKGVHGLSNSLLDVPWPKVTRGIKTLANIIKQEDIAVDDLFAMMADREQPDDVDLPRTGVSLEWERLLAPMLVTGKNYGTRASTILLADRNNRVQLWERSFVPADMTVANEVYYEFDIKH